MSRSCRAALKELEPRAASPETLAPAKEQNSADAPFSVSYEAGQYDANGNFMGGTETMSLVAYSGKLYAGIGYWEDNPGRDPRPGPQVLVKDSAWSPWRVDHSFSERDSDGEELRRVTALAAATFSTGADGSPLSHPASMLIAGFDVSESSNDIAFAFSRDERSGKWARLAVKSKTFRAVTIYRDPITLVDRVFLGSGGIGRKESKVISGVYDANSPGNIRWDRDEVDDFGYRVMAFAEANRTLYFSAKPVVYGRLKNGPVPQWRPVYSYEQRVREAHHFVEGKYRIGGNAGMRGLTAVPSPDGDGQALLGVIEGVPGEVVRINPSKNYEPTLEQNIDDLLFKHWNYLPGPNVERGQEQAEGLNKGYILAAYNDIPTIAENPETHEPVLFIGMQAHNPLPGHRNSAWYLIRETANRYTLHEVPPLTSKRGNEKPLVAVRTAVLSPFPEEKGKVIYMGGYDCDWRPAHNTAWIYRAGVRTVLREH